MIAILTDTSTQPRKPIQETYSWTDSTSDEGVYEEVNDIRMAMLPTPVAATDEKKQSRPRPPTKPKPKARPSTIQPRGTYICSVHDTIIITRYIYVALWQLFNFLFSVNLLPVARPFLKQTTQDSTQSTRQPTNSYSNSDAYTRAGYDVDDAYYEDFTGSSDYTGTGTGDSGFGDAAFLRRIPLKPKAPTQSQLEASNECYESLTSARAGYYKSLNMETVEGECDVNYSGTSVNVSSPTYILLQYHNNDLYIGAMALAFVVELVKWLLYWEQKSTNHPGNQLVWKLLKGNSNASLLSRGTAP